MGGVDVGLVGEVGDFGFGIVVVASVAAGVGQVAGLECEFGRGF